MYDGKPICYYRGSILDYLNPEPEMKWINLNPDPAIKLVKADEEFKAGIVSFRFFIKEKSDASTNGF